MGDGRLHQGIAGFQFIQNLRDIRLRTSRDKGLRLRGGLRIRQAVIRRQQRLAGICAIRRGQSADGVAKANHDITAQRLLRRRQRIGQCLRGLFRANHTNAQRGRRTIILVVQKFCQRGDSRRAFLAAERDRRCGAFTRNGVQRTDHRLFGGRTGNTLQRVEGHYSRLLICELRFNRGNLRITADTGQLPQSEIAGVNGAFRLEQTSQSGGQLLRAGFLSGSFRIIHKTFNLTCFRIVN